MAGATGAVCVGEAGGSVVVGGSVVPPPCGGGGGGGSGGSGGAPPSCGGRCAPPTAPSRRRRTASGARDRNGATRATLNTRSSKMQLVKCLVLVVASVLAGASTSDGASLQLRSQHSLESSLRSKAFQRAFLAKTDKRLGQRQNFWICGAAADFLTGLTAFFLSLLLLLQLRRILLVNVACAPGCRPAAV